MRNKHKYQNSYPYYVRSCLIQDIRIFHQPKYALMLRENILFYKNSLKFRLYCFVILADSLHLIIKTSHGANVSKIMQCIKYRTASDIRNYLRLEHCPAVFEGEKARGGDIRNGNRGCGAMGEIGFNIANRSQAVAPEIREETGQNRSQAVAPEIREETGQNRSQAVAPEIREETGQNRSQAVAPEIRQQQPIFSPQPSATKKQPQSSVMRTIPNPKSNQSNLEYPARCIGGDPLVCDKFKRGEHSIWRPRFKWEILSTDEKISDTYKIMQDQYGQSKLAEINFYSGLKK